MPSTRLKGMNDQRPLVSCIMPTCNRPQFVSQAISYFQRQGYSPRELIIVDDGDIPVAGLVPNDPNIHYIRLDKRLALGEKRNIACKAGRGDLIAHWDDDDWISPDRLSIQVEHLGQASVCGSAELLHYDLTAGEAWLYSYPAEKRPWLAGCTLLYRREAWANNPFKPKNNGEDTAFVWQLPANQIRAIPDIDLVVSIIHGRNTALRSLNNPRWERLHISEVRSKLGADSEFYAALRSGLNPAMGGKRPEQSKRPVKQAAAARTAGNGRYQVSPPKTTTYTALNRVTVSIPYYRCKPYIRRAVESILAQSYGNLILVVVNDNDEDEPWDLLADIDDPRLVRFDLRENRGRYFADAVVLNATPDPYFLVQDADDYSEPERIGTLLYKLREDHADGVVSGLFKIDVERVGTAGRRPVQFSPGRRRLRAKLAHRLSHFGLFRVAALKEIGGFYGGFRISYDTLLMNLLMMTGRVSYVEEPLYTRVIRPDSLTTSQATGLQSAERSRVRRYHDKIFHNAYAAYNRYLAGELSAGELANYIREQSQQHVTAAEQAALNEESARLRSAMLRGGLWNF